MPDTTTNGTHDKRTTQIVQNYPRAMYIKCRFSFHFFNGVFCWYRWCITRDLWNGLPSRVPYCFVNLKKKEVFGIHQPHLAAKTDRSHGYKPSSDYALLEIWPPTTAQPIFAAPLPTIA